MFTWFCSQYFRESSLINEIVEEKRKRGEKHIRIDFLFSFYPGGAIVMSLAIFSLFEAKLPIDYNTKYLSYFAGFLGGQICDNNVKGLNFVF